MSISLYAVLSECGVLSHLDQTLSEHGATDKEIKRLQKDIAQEITQILISHGCVVVEDFEPPLQQ